MRKLLPKILVTILFGVILLLVGINTASAQAAPAVVQADSLLAKVKCKDLWDCVEKIPTSIPLIISYALYIITAGILAISGYLFDAVLSLSIDKTFILKDFINSTWIILRDFSNMAFIFVLLYTGIQTMFGLGDWRKTVIKVIIVALLINFSLFFTKIIIDAGNILAVGIYESVGAVKVAKVHTQGGSVSEREISSVLTAQFGPQTFMEKSAKIDSHFLAIALFIIGSIANILVAFAFFRVSLVFIGRIIGFWFLMIVSPFAFISTTFPKGNIFQKWLDNLLGLSFVAPVFLFFIYLIMQAVAGGNILGSLIDPDPNNMAAFSFDVLFIPVIMVIFIYMALDKAVSVSKDMAGGFGKLGSDMGGLVMGLAGGAVLGGAAMAGRGLGGKLAAKAFEGGTMQRWAASEKTGLLGAAQRNLGMRGTMALDTARNATWDARNVGLVGKGIKATGVDMGKGGKVGYVQGQKDWIKEQKKKAALMEVTEGEKEIINKKYDVKNKQENATKQLEVAEEHAARVKEAERKRAQLESDIKNTPESIALTAMRNQLKTQTDEAEKATKEREAVQQALNTSLDPVGTQKALDAAVLKEKQALDAVKAAQGLVDKANVDYTAATKNKIDAADNILKSAKDNFETANKIAAVAVDEAKKAEKFAGDEVSNKNKERRGAYAKQVTPGISPVVGQVVGGVGGFMAAGPAGAMAGGAAGAALAAKFGPKNISEARTKKIKAIREGKTDKEKEEEDVAKMLEKLAKKLPKEEKKEEGGEKH